MRAKVGVSLLLSDALSGSPIFEGRVQWQIAVALTKGLNFSFRTLKSAAINNNI